MGTGRVLYRYPGHTLPGPIFNLNLALSPTYGQMKAISRFLMRFPNKGPERVLELTRIDPRIDPPDPGPEMAPDDPQIPYPRTSGYQWSRIGSFIGFIDGC